MTVKNIFFFSSDGFPTKKNFNLGIFTFEQAKTLKNYNRFLFDLSTNNSNQIFIDEYQGLKIYRLLNSKYNIIKIFKNILFLRKIFKKIKPEIILSSFLNIKNFIYSIFLDSKRIILIHG